MLNLTENFKYYKQELNNPFVKSDQNAALWWGGEKALADAIKDNPEFPAMLEAEYDTALAEKALGGVLADTTLPKEKRVIIFYLDLWHGRNFPWDTLDAINQY